MFDDKINFVFDKMIEHEKSVPKRVQHLLKVYGFAKFIGKNEGLDEHTMLLLETAALMHDIGIKPAIEKYNSSAGKYQETEGIEPARYILEEAGYEESDISRICYLIGHHHTYNDIDGMDYQILVEADFLVNIYEDNESKDAILNVKEKIFKTKYGIKLLNEMYL